MDVERHLEALPASAPLIPSNLAQPLDGGQSTQEAPVRLGDAREKKRIPLKGPRLIIAKRLSQSASTIPHVYIHLVVDMSEAVRLREQVKAHYETLLGRGISYTAIIVRAVAHLLPKHPLLNSSILEDDIVLWEDVHIGMAVDLDDYLIVPVIREAHKMNLEQTAAAIAGLLDKARKRKLQPVEMSGSTFSISNLGMLGAASFTAIINPPETAILAVGKISDTVVAVDGQVGVRPMMNLTLGIDHRVIDGAAGTRFLTDLKALLENPYLMM